jgi:hypothetical protein
MERDARRILGHINNLSDLSDEQNIALDGIMHDAAYLAMIYIINHREQLKLFEKEGTFDDDDQINEERLDQLHAFDRIKEKAHEPHTDDEAVRQAAIAIMNFYFAIRGEKASSNAYEIFKNLGGMADKIDIFDPRGPFNDKLYTEMKKYIVKHYYVMDIKWALPSTAYTRSAYGNDSNVVDEFKNKNAFVYRVLGLTTDEQGNAHPSTGGKRKSKKSKISKKKSVNSKSRKVKKNRKNKTRKS